MGLLETLSGLIGKLCKRACESCMGATGGYIYMELVQAAERCKGQARALNG